MEVFSCHFYNIITFNMNIELIRLEMMNELRLDNELRLEMMNLTSTLPKNSEKKHNTGTFMCYDFVLV